MPWENVTQYENPNLCWQLWKFFYLQVLNRHAPFICMRIRGNSRPWISRNIKNLMRARDFHWTKYKNIRNKVKSELYKAKKSYFCDKFEGCAQTKEPKQSWHHINHLMGKNYKSNNIPQIKIGETIISDNLMIDLWLHGIMRTSESKKDYGGVKNRDGARVAWLINVIMSKIQFVMSILFIHHLFKKLVL